MLEMRLKLIKPKPQDPEKLWVSPDATTAVDEDFYNQYFGPFWRIEQLIITAPDSNGNPTQILTNKPALMEALQLQNELTSIEVNFNNGTIITFGDLCYEPVPGEVSSSFYELLLTLSNAKTSHHTTGLFDRKCFRNLAQ